MSFAQLKSNLQRLLGRPLTAEQAREAIARRLRQRERAFLLLLRRAVFANPRSPYLVLFGRAGISLEDLSRDVSRDGLEATLARLYNAGVYVTPEEFRGRTPIRRPGVEVPVDPHDFDNPLIAHHYEARTSGSRGAALSVPIDFRLLAHEAAYVHHFLEGHALYGRPHAAWRGVPPISSGVNMLLRYAKLGLRVEKWFAQNKLPVEPGTLASRRFTRDLVRASRELGWWLPAPDYVHQDDAVRIARWLAKQRAAGTPAQLDTNASSGVRVCLAALDRGLDVSGTFFRLGGEPYTPDKADVILQAGCRAATHYSTTEVSHLGMACAAPADVDDVHLLTDKLAVIERALPENSPGGSVQALVFTTLLPSAPKILINVESGDSGVLARRACGCPFERLGLDLHLSRLRSYENITSEGLSYLRGDLVPLVEQVLPARFGGHASDYQLVEVESRGMPYVEVLVGPRVGQVDEGAVAQTVYEWLRGRPHGPLVTGFWQDANTVRISRRTPYATSSAKILPLHTLRRE